MRDRNYGSSVLCSGIEVDIVGIGVGIVGIGSNFGSRFGSRRVETGTMTIVGFCAILVGILWIFLCIRMGFFILVGKLWERL